MRRVLRPKERGTVERQMSILGGSVQPLRHATTMFANAAIGPTCLVSICREREGCPFAKKPSLTKPRHTTRILVIDTRNPSPLPATPGRPEAEEAACAQPLPVRLRLRLQPVTITHLAQIQRHCAPPHSIQYGMSMEYLGKQPETSMDMKLMFFSDLAFHSFPRKSSFSALRRQRSQVPILSGAPVFLLLN